MPRYFDGCTLPGGFDYGPYDDWEPVEEVELCEACESPAKVGRLCHWCNMTADIDAMPIELIEVKMNANGAD